MPRLPKRKRKFLRDQALVNAYFAHASASDLAAKETARRAEKDNLGIFAIERAKGRIGSGHRVLQPRFSRIVLKRAEEEGRLADSFYSHEKKKRAARKK